MTTIGIRMTGTMILGKPLAVEKLGVSLKSFCWKQQKRYLVTLKSLRDPKPLVLNVLEDILRMLQLLGIAL